LTPLAFDRTLEQFGDAPALVAADGTILSHAELAATADRIGQHLPREKELVFILCGRNPATVAGYLAVLRANQAAALLDSELAPTTLTALEKQYRPEWIFEPVATGQDYLWRELGYGLRRTDDGSREHGIIHPDLALLLSTSGTTGSPKMVRLSRDNLHANAAAIVEYLGIGSQDRAVTTLPFHYSYGLSIVNTHLAAGASLVLSEESLMSRAFWDLCKTRQVTSLAGVPYHYEILLRLRFFSMDLPCLRTLTQAGGRLRPGIVQQFAEHAAKSGRRFFVMYGQTEAAPRIAYLPPELAARHPDSIGIAIPGGRLWLQDDDGRIIDQADREGELVYQGPNVMLGYARCREDLGAGDELGGILHTGDRARRDNQGLYTITGRQQRFLKLFGNRINLDEVERLLEKNGCQALCGGKDDALLILVTDPAAEQRARDCVTSTLGVHHSAVSVQTVARFQVSESGKLDYRKTFAALGNE
jgi:acyl-coenzyme A synthetase/AMP-(fatty) acid ligase